VSTPTPSDTASGDSPIDAFSDCHAGIVAHLERLAGLPALLEPARQARQTAQDALCFFHDVIHEHHADEERELFPAVLGAARKGEEREKVERIVERLVQDHRRLESTWAALEPDLKNMSKGHDHHLEVASLNALVTGYQSHAAYEERVFLPLAQTILGRDDNQMAALGLSLHLRRAVPEVLAKYGYRL
jgi:hemerythrin-like domain-containing protein